MLFLVVLIQLHSPNGGVIWVNPDEITSLQGPQGHKHFTDKAECLINLADGKFVAVTDDCTTVHKLMEDKR
jgi:hypothetical protein